MSGAILLVRHTAKCSSGQWPQVVYTDNKLYLLLKACLTFQRIHVSENWFHNCIQNILLKLCHWYFIKKFNQINHAYMRQWTGSVLVQEMACRLFGAKPLPEPMLVCCRLNSWEQISVKFESEFYHFHKKNASEIVVCQNSGHFVQGEMS